MAKKAAEPKRKVRPARKKEPLPARPSNFLLIGIGASAGGLEAMIDLLHHLPELPGAAFVIIHHADPTHPSSLRYILSRETKLNVVDLTDGM